MKFISSWPIFFCKLVIHLTQIGFFVFFALSTITEQYGPSPLQGMTHFTGLAALNTLLLTLCLSPIAKWTKQAYLMRCRRLLGLYAFFWASLHVFIYFSLDIGFDLSFLADEIISRPYLTLGAITWFILFLLTLTSTRWSQRKLGKHWQTLHNLVYLALILAPIHFYWSVKSELIEPTLYLIFAILLLFTRRKRILSWFK